MNNEELLQILATKLEVGELTRKEILAQLDLTKETEPATPIHKKFAHFSFSPAKLLYALGAIIVIVGIAIFVAQIWDDIGSAGRIATTLGLGLIIAASGSVLLKQKPQNAIGAIFHTIGGVLIPSGGMVTLYELTLVPPSLWQTTTVFGVIFLFYLFLNTFHKHPILTFFTIANGTTFIYFLVAAMTNVSYYEYRDLYAYLTMVVGLSYLLLGRSFHGGWNRSLIGLLYFLGSGGFLWAAFSQVEDSLTWLFLYFFLVLGGLFLSIQLKSRGILILSTIFLIIHISYITGEYFADSLGWPISLVILGFIFIGLGYSSFSINKKYLTTIESKP